MFQCFMDRVLAGIPFVIVYLDDILVASPSYLEHEVHLRQVLTRLREHGLVLNLGKCSFFKRQVDFLDLRITAAGAAPLPGQVRAIADFPCPSTVKELKAFLGTINFYVWFVASAAHCRLEGRPQGRQPPSVDR